MSPLSLSATVLPLLGVLHTLDPSQQASQPRVLLPAELAGAATSQQCLVAAERSGAHEVAFTASLQCPEALLPYAKAAVAGLHINGPTPAEFQTTLRWGVDPNAAGLGGRAGSYEGNVAWMREPKITEQRLPSWTAVPAGAEGECSFLLHLDKEGVQQTIPLDCPALLQAAAEATVARWSYRMRGKSAGPMLLPVTLRFDARPEAPLPPLDERDPASLTVPVADPSLCYFSVWRDKEGEVLSYGAEWCTPELWSQLDPSSLFLPAPEVTEGDFDQVLVWNPEAGLVSEAPFLPSMRPVPVETPKARNPGAALAEAARDCEVLAILDDHGNLSELRSLTCPQELMDAARSAARKSTFLRFDRPGFERSRHQVMRIQFEGVTPGPYVDAPARSIPYLKKAKHPKYPELLRGAPREAWCVLRLEIDAQGHVSRVSPDVDCPKAFAEALLDVIPKWRFFPAKRDGVAVSADFVFNVKFQLD